MSTPDAVLLLAADATKAPDEVCLLRYGEVQTRKGLVRVTDRSLRLVAEQWRKYGRDMGFDYGHDQFNGNVPEKDKIAAGWGRVECRPGLGVFAFGIRWTDEARRKIEARELRYTSPAISVDPKTRELTGLENCALTNIPATLNPAPLTLSAAVEDMTPPEDVREAAARGLELRRRFGRGGTPVGWARARDLAAGRRVSPETIRRMVAYFSRHAADKKAERWGNPHDPSPGYVAWLLWGGDPGERWARSLAERLDLAVPVTGGPAALVTAAPHLSRKATPQPGATMSANENQNAKHLQIARKLAAGMAGMLAAAQMAAESDDEKLKALGAKLAEGIPEHMQALGAAYPDMGHEEPDGDEGEGEGEKLQKYSAVAAKLQELTGCGEGLMGGLLALHAQASAKVEQAKAAELTAEQVKAAKVDHMIKRTGQIGPKERDSFLNLSAADLDAYAKVAPRRFPAADAKAPAVETVTPAAPDVVLSADALKIGADLLGLRPEDVGLKA